MDNPIVAFHQNLHEVFLPALRSGELPGIHAEVDAAVRSVISDNSAWVGLLGYLISDEDEPRIILEESAERLKKELRDDVSLSRVYTILSVAGLGWWREFEEITPDAVMAMRLDHSNAVAYDLLSDIYVDYDDTTRTKKWIARVARHCWGEES